MTAVLFRASDLDAVTLTEADIPALQAFFEANPAYFMAVHGEPAHAKEGAEEFYSVPPPEFSFSKTQVLGFRAADGQLQGMANIVADFIAKDVWHIGTFIVATARHGKGDAQALYAALENWIVGQGAQWLRLGVVQGHVRAERFWKSCGYVELRLRHGLAMGKRINTVRVMLKPLAGGTPEQYLALVPRDRPDA